MSIEPAVEEPCGQLHLCSVKRGGIKPPPAVHKPTELLANSQPPGLARFRLPAQQPCEHLREHSPLLTQPHVFKLSASLLLSHSSPLFASPVVIYVVVSMERWTPARKAPLLTAAPSVLRTLLDNSSTSVYRPIGALVCKLKKGQVARLSNTAPFLFVVTVLVALSEAEPDGVNATPAASEEEYQVLFVLWSGL